jgi:hypothetical protein
VLDAEEAARAAVVAPLKGAVQGVIRRLFDSVSFFRSFPIGRVRHLGSDLD